MVKCSFIKMLGSLYCIKEGKLHRANGPAVIFPNGSEEWWLNNKLHRVGGPAVSYANGTKKWFINGKIHRVDGPAIEYADGRGGLYFLDDEYFHSKKCWVKAVRKLHPELYRPKFYQFLDYIKSIFIGSSK